MILDVLALIGLLTLLWLWYEIILRTASPAWIGQLPSPVSYILNG